MLGDHCATPAAVNVGWQDRGLAMGARIDGPCRLFARAIERLDTGEIQRAIALGAVQREEIAGL